MWVLIVGLVPSAKSAYSNTTYNSLEEKATKLYWSQQQSLVQYWGMERPQYPLISPGNLFNSC